MRIKYKKLLLVAGITLITSFCFSEQVKADADPEIKADNYAMDVKLNTKRNQLNETVTITVKNNGQNSVKEVVVRNIAYGVLKYNRKHFKKHNKNVKTTVYSVSEEGKNLSYNYGEDHSNLYVTLPSDLKAGQSQAITLKLTTDVPYRKDRFGYQNIRGGKVYNLSFCFPYLSDYRNGQWNYHPYSDEGENRNNGVSNYHVSFYAPKSYKVAATGDNSIFNGKTTIEARDARDMAIVASNRFKVSHAKADGIVINNFYLPGKKSSNYNKLTKQTAIDSLKLFDKKVGKYPYKELDITEYPFNNSTGGMEYPGLIMISGNGFLNKKKSPNSYAYTELVGDVSHEVAHQWFYSTIGTDEYTEPWLDEGMAEFFEESVYGLTKTPSRTMQTKMMHVKFTDKDRRRLVKTFNAIIKMDIKDNKRSIINYPLNKIPKGKDEADIAYDTAKMFYDELMVAMGKQKFFQAMQDYYRTYYLKQTTGREFLNIIRKYDNSKKVNKIISNFIDPKYL
ncbi:M1 family metallopeptidase [Lactobacillus hamsteri]|uniref:Aminopeptidase n=1 Tax=Lactobacillus hamsteri DSM 5661 = JCM 6256 TaxID=1423754 RepID=A0A0R1Y6U6_9LACO|nr:M1 family metallopeptidase [Lactobacillus hamsteri]KRM38130.1 aminopeptidase [Lactobacillus hamsteri DSM 5661 = JCM 6256]